MSRRGGGPGGTTSTSVGNTNGNGGGGVATTYIPAAALKRFADELESNATSNRFLEINRERVQNFIERPYLEQQKAENAKAKHERTVEEVAKRAQVVPGICHYSHATPALKSTEVAGTMAAPLTINALSAKHFLEFQQQPEFQAVLGVRSRFGEGDGSFFDRWLTSDAATSRHLLDKHKLPIMKETLGDVSMGFKRHYRSYKTGESVSNSMDKALMLPYAERRRLRLEREAIERAAIEKAEKRAHDAALGLPDEELIAAEKKILEEAQHAADDATPEVPPVEAFCVVTNHLLRKLAHDFLLPIYVESENSRRFYLAPAEKANYFGANARVATFAYHQQLSRQRVAHGSTNSFPTAEKFADATYSEVSRAVSPFSSKRLCNTTTKGYLPPNVEPIEPHSPPKLELSDGTVVTPGRIQPSSKSPRARKFAEKRTQKNPLPAPLSSPPSRSRRRQRSDAAQSVALEEDQALLHHLTISQRVESPLLSESRSNVNTTDNSANLTRPNSARTHYLQLCLDYGIRPQPALLIRKLPPGYPDVGTKPHVPLSAVSLSFSSLSLTNKHARILGSSLPYLPLLQRLEVCDLQLTSQPNLVEDSLQQLLTLDDQPNEDEDSDCVLGYFVCCVALCPSIREFIFSRNRIGVHTTEAIVQWLVGTTRASLLGLPNPLSLPLQQSTMCCLISLQITHAELDDDDAIFILEAACRYKQLERLDFSHNQLGTHERATLRSSPALSHGSDDLFLGLMDIIDRYLTENSAMLHLTDPRISSEPVLSYVRVPPAAIPISRPHTNDRLPQLVELVCQYLHDWEDESRTDWTTYTADVGLCDLETLSVASASGISNPSNKNDAFADGSSSQSGETLENIEYLSASQSRTNQKLISQIDMFISKLVRESNVCNSSSPSSSSTVLNRLEEILAPSSTSYNESQMTELVSLYLDSKKQDILNTGLDDQMMRLIESYLETIYDDYGRSAAGVNLNKDDLTPLYDRLHELVVSIYSAGNSKDNYFQYLRRRREARRCKIRERSLQKQVTPIDMEEPLETSLLSQDAPFFVGEALAKLLLLSHPTSTSGRSALKSLSLAWNHFSSLSPLLLMFGVVFGDSLTSLDISFNPLEEKACEQAMAMLTFYPKVQLIRYNRRTKATEEYFGRRMTNERFVHQNRRLLAILKLTTLIKTIRVSVHRHQANLTKKAEEFAEGSDESIAHMAASLAAKFTGLEGMSNNMRPGTSSATRGGINSVLGNTFRQANLICSLRQLNLTSTNLRPRALATLLAGLKNICTFSGATNSTSTDVIGAISSPEVLMSVIINENMIGATGARDLLAFNLVFSEQVHIQAQNCLVLQQTTPALQPTHGATSSRATTSAMVSRTQMIQEKARDDKSSDTSDCWFDPFNAVGTFRLRLSDPYDRAVASELLRIVAHAANAEGEEGSLRLVSSRYYEPREDPRNEKLGSDVPLVVFVQNTERVTRASSPPPSPNGKNGIPVKRASRHLRSSFLRSSFGDAMMSLVGDSLNEEAEDTLSGDHLIRIRERFRKTATKIFAQFDADDSGSLDRSELIDLVLEVRLVSSATEAFRLVDSVLERYDVDHSGRVEEEEFVAFLMDLRRRYLAIDMDSNATARYMVTSSTLASYKSSKVPPPPYEPPIRGTLVLVTEQPVTRATTTEYRNVMSSEQVRSLLDLSRGLVSSASLVSLAITSSKWTYAQLLPVFPTLLKEIGSLIALVVKLLPQMATPMDARLLVASAANQDYGLLATIRTQLGPLFRVYTGLRTGFYQLNLSFVSHREALAFLLCLHEEAVTLRRDRHGLGDTSQYGDWLISFRNCVYEKRPLKATIDWLRNPPERGLLEFDFVWLRHEPLKIGATGTSGLNFSDELPNASSIDMDTTGSIAVEAAPISNFRLYRMLVALGVVDSSRRKHIFSRLEASANEVRTAATGSGTKKFEVQRNGAATIAARIDGFLETYTRTRHTLEHYAVSMGEEESLLLDGIKKNRRRNKLSAGMEPVSPRTAAAINAGSTGSSSFTLPPISSDSLRLTSVSEDTTTTKSDLNVDMTTPLSEIGNMDMYGSYLAELQRNDQIDPHIISMRLLDAFETILAGRSLTCIQLAMIVDRFPSGHLPIHAFGSYRVELIIALFSNLLDVINFDAVLRELEPLEIAQVIFRLGYLHIWTPMKPEGWIVLNLNRREERLIAKMLVTLNYMEEGETWQKASYRTIDIDDWKRKSLENVSSDVESLVAVAISTSKPSSASTPLIDDGGTESAVLELFGVNCRDDAFLANGNTEESESTWKIPSQWYTEQLPTHGYLSLQYFSGKGIKLQNCMSNISVRIALSSLVLASPYESDVFRFQNFHVEKANELLSSNGISFSFTEPISPSPHPSARANTKSTPRV